ncbi:hypothetical protein [Larkinella terrae]|uniref:Uncharacterized protein n=1 Tax=Larkinella terrae TaxID=2025311 RepID=A0A7K0EJZ4_9BACT|nr:hypothetical protein [Larkinella terrae]MRS61768.1 hypothetical protein [Larkinella terrae]
MKRRAFLAKSLAAVGAVSVLGATIKPERYVLYGDGVHDDTKALQAYFDGKEVFWAHIIDYQSPSGVARNITGKTLLLSDTIYLRNKIPTHVQRIKDCHVLAASGFKGDSVFHATADCPNRVLIDSCYIDGRNLVRAGLVFKNYA